MLKKLTNGGKTIVGVVAMSLLKSLFDVEIISEWWFELLNPFAMGLASIGLIHKVQKFIDKKGT